jgi:SpoVK/Ycf46/Vps4 family AAA+-type ATPase
MSQWSQPFSRGQMTAAPMAPDLIEVPVAGSGPYIPERFARQISSHLLANIGEVPGTPLILGVHGAPGTGKTYQIECVLKQMGVDLFAISGGQLESQNAGEPAELIRTTYGYASDVLKAQAPACIVFNDIDTGGGEWEGNTGTVNHQTVLGELMHLVDFPKQVDGKATRRVPIIMTGNDFTKLYEPLRRPGRMRLFEWAPNVDERVEIIASIFPSRGRQVAKALATQYEALPLSFYSDLKSALVDNVLHGLYGSVAAQSQAIREVLEKKRPLSVSSDSVPDAEVLAVAQKLARTFSVTSHLGGTSPQAGGST